MFVAKADKSNIRSPFGVVMSKVMTTSCAHRKIDEVVRESCIDHAQFLDFYQKCVIVTRLGLYTHCEIDWACDPRGFEGFMEIYGSLCQDPQEPPDQYLSRTKIANKDFARMVLNDYMHFVMKFSPFIMDTLEQASSPKTQITISLF